MSKIDVILSRLDKVRPGSMRGTWMARCPAHNDKGPSLSIRELDDGRILIHDFGGCDTSDVLGALGLRIDDLFAEPSPGHHDARNGKRYGIERRPFPASDTLRCIAYECLIVLTCAVDVHTGNQISDADRERLGITIGRIQAALTAAGIPCEGYKVAA